MKKIFLVALAFVFIASFSAQAEGPAVMDEMETHMKELQASISQIQGIKDHDKLQRALKEHFSKIKTHLGLMSKMANNQRSFGTKSTRNRMQYRVKELISQFNAVLAQVQTAQSKLECD